MKFLDRMAWIDRLPRPDSSGAKGVVLMLGLLWYGLSPIPSGEQGGPLDAVICEVMPWKCLGRDQMELDLPFKEKRFLVVPLIDPLAHGHGPKICACHIDVHFVGKAVRHIHFPREQTCDSDYAEPREWTVAAYPPDWAANGISEDSKLVTRVYIPVYIETTDPREVIEMQVGEGEYRFHCE